MGASTENPLGTHRGEPDMKSRQQQQTLSQRIRDNLNRQSAVNALIQSRGRVCIVKCDQCQAKHDRNCYRVPYPCLQGAISSSLPPLHFQCNSNGGILSPFPQCVRKPGHFGGYCNCKLPDYAIRCSVRDDTGRQRGFKRATICAG